MIGFDVSTLPLEKKIELTRALADFAKLVELFDEHGVSFVSITQPHTSPILPRIFGFRTRRNSPGNSAP
jgi:DNA invertase Pin-like site-specific DNA recombinase